MDLFVPVTVDVFVFEMIKEFVAAVADATRSVGLIVSIAVAVGFVSITVVAVGTEKIVVAAEKIVVVAEIKHYL